MVNNTKPLCSCLDATVIDQMGYFLAKEESRLILAEQTELDIIKTVSGVRWSDDSIDNNKPPSKLNNLERGRTYDYSMDVLLAEEHLKQTQKSLNDLKILMNRLEYTDVCPEHDSDLRNRNRKHIQTLRDAKQRGGIYQEIRTALDAMMTESDKMFE